MNDFFNHLKDSSFRHLLFVVIASVGSIYTYYSYEHNHYQGLITIAFLLIVSTVYLVANIVYKIVQYFRKKSQ